MSEGAALTKIRRGLGVVFILAGLIHAGEMVLAVLYSQGKIPLIITAALWSRLYFAHFLFLVMGSLLYLTLTFRSTGVFYFLALGDFLIGIGAFIILMTATAFALVRHMMSPWFSLTPSVFLASYGAILCAGRTFMPKSLDASPKP